MAYRFSQGDRPLAGYTIERGVGRGGFGEVYYALSDGGKEVALKYLRENPQVELRGATHCLNLKSPYLIALHDIKQSAEGEYFVIMEYVNGVSLRDLMNEAPRGLGVQKAAYFAREIAKGLAYLHDRGIVHRDLKPGNIFYEDGFVKIGDYGLSKMMAASQHSGQTMSVGTVHYMAPEVGSGNYDRTIDIYAMGVILYEMLLGRVPYSGASMGEVLMKHLTAQPEVDELPAPFPQVIRKALAKDPKDRYQTINEMVADLFEVEDLSRSVAAFEPASLSTLAANAARKMVTANAGAGPNAAGIGGGGAAGFGTGSSNVGAPIAPPLIPQAAGRMGRLNERVHRLADRMDHSVVGEKVAGIVGGAQARPQAIVKAVCTCVAMAGAATVIRHQRPEFGVAISLQCFAVLGAVAIWRKWIDRGTRTAGDFSSKMTFAVLASAITVIVNRFVVETNLVNHNAEYWLMPVIASFLFCDWRGRLEDGRRGLVSLGSAFYIGLFGFIVYQIGDGRDSLPVAAILAGASLGVQALAGMWPIRAEEEPRGLMASSGSSGVESARVGSSAMETVWAGQVGISRDGQGSNAAMPPGRLSQVESSGRMARLPARNGTVRLIWLCAFVILTVAMILCFIASATIRMGVDEQSGCILAGIILAPFTLFMASCAAPRLHKGLWRGIFRKLIFFTGIAMVAGFGSAIGLFSLQNEEAFGALSGLLVGVAAALIVWMLPIPMPILMPKPAAGGDDKTDEFVEEDRDRRVKAKWCRAAGFGLIGLAFVITPILCATLGSRDLEDALPGTLIPMGLVSTGFLIAASKLSPKRGRKKAAPPLELPIRRIFTVESKTLLRRLLERHTFLFNYRADREGDLLWRYVRGDWTAQFWQSDIRRWKTELTIAAYEDGQGGYRVTCQLDVDAGFNSPDKKMLERLNSEMDDLETLLVQGSSAGGREIAV